MYAYLIKGVHFFSNPDGGCLCFEIRKHEQRDILRHHKALCFFSNYTVGKVLADFAVCDC